MKLFSDYIKESKNLHMEHIEDSVFNEGSSGVMEAIKFLESLSDMLSGEDASNVRVTVKWDGAPAIFCGINPENDKFFVGTKSVFNKRTPKINYTDADIDANHTGTLASKLKIALEHLPDIGIKGVLQGDMLFTDDVTSKKINGEISWVFTPNTITYTVPIGTDLGKEISKAKIGIIFHTNYTGNTMAEMRAGSTPNVSLLTKSSKVWFDDADIEDYSSVMLSSSEKSSIDDLLKQCKTLLRKSSKMINHISSDSNLVAEIKVFSNTLVREGSVSLSVNGFIKHMESRLDKDIASVKTDVAKARKQKAKDEFMKKIKSHSAQLTSAFELQQAMTNAKIPIIRKLETIKTMGTFIKKNNGYDVTAPEGFVVIGNDKSLKLVDRLEFSRNNFTVSKDWDK